MKKFKKLKKAIALSLALAVATTTNLGGLQNVVKVKASRWEACRYTDSKGVDWQVLFDYDSDGNPINYRVEIKNPLALENVDIEVPTSINGYKIEKFDGFDASYSTCKAKSITIPDGIVIANGAFSNCTFDTMYVTCEEFRLYDTKEFSVKDIVFDGTNGIYISQTELSKSNISSVTIKNTDSITIDEKTFDGCQTLNSLNVEDSVKSVIIGDKAFNSCTGLKDITINSDVTLNQAAFANCTGLRNVTFNGYVCINALQVRFYMGQVYANYRNLGGVFHNSFAKEYDENGKVIKKTLTFNNMVTSKRNGSYFSTSVGNFRMESTGDFPDCDRYVIDNCPGLTDVIFNNHATLTDNFFYNCENLTNIEFNGFTELGNKIFENIPVEKLVFNDQVRSLETKDMGSGHMINDVDTNPFDQCQAKTLIFNHSSYAFTIANMPNLETLFFSASRIGAPEYKTQYGTADMEIKLKDCDYLKTIIIYPDPNELEHNSQNDTLNEMLKYFEVNLDNNSPTVYGYEFKDAVDNYIKTWATKSGLTFQNIVSKMLVKYNDTIIGDDLTRSDIDTSKISVTAEFPYDVAKFFDSVDLPNYDVKNGKIDVPLATDTENTGFAIETLPEKLEEGKNTFYVSYSGIHEAGIINTEKLKVVSIKVNWNDTKISDLVSNQPITATTVASGATIYYNNGTTDTISSEALVLDKTVTTLGDNIFTVSLKENQDIKESKTFSIKENYITDIKASYNSSDIVYVGDKIDINKVKITPTYKYDNDETVNRDITDFKISDTELKKAGENEFVVSYNDLQTTIVVSATAVVPTNLYAIFDSNCTYVEGQEIDPKIIAVTVEYNNGTKKSGSDIQYAYDIEVKTITDKYIQVLVSYQGCNTTVDIPVTPKQVTSIKASAKIASATEGTTLAKTIINKIEVTYNNGKTETLDESNINYDSLTFNDYTIVANTNNTITVNYAGKTSDITIFGVPNSITSIFAEYIGSGQIVGTEIPVKDVSVHAVNADGQITNITEGILLENAIPYNVGSNTVIVHYGAFTYSIVVPGLPAPSVSPDATVAPNTNAPIQTETPTTTVPVQTNKPIVSETPAPTQPSSTVVVTTPDNADSAPVPTLANTTVTVKSNNSKVVISTNKTYKVYTNKNVTFTVSAVAASDIKYQIVAKSSKITTGKWKSVVNNKITVTKTTKASIVYIQYTDGNGKVQTIHTNGFTIDKKAATINVKKNKTYGIGKKITFKDSSGISSAKLNGKKIKSGTKINKAGSYKLVVTDKAGNKKSISFKIK